MFIYTGKLEWYSSAVDELLVVVLPNGPVRVGDEIFTYSQWTKDSKGNKKVKFFQHQFIDKVTRADNGDDTFTFGRGYYSYKVQVQEGYRTISLTMSNPAGAERNMSLDRTYLPSGETSTGSARIWTGTLNWPQYATDELIVAIVPEGFGPTNPILAFWQWTVDQNNQPKVNYVYTGSQQTETPAEGSLKFSTTGDYAMTCTWDEKTEKLAIHMEGPDKYTQDVGPLDLATVITYHSDDFTPPQLPGESVQLELHYPQAEPALPRIQSPMPFPPTLTETLAHTASFVDRAGYLAKYAVDRYHALDKSYHALIKQTDELNAQIRDLSGQVDTLTGENHNEKTQITSLQKQLTDTLTTAAQKEAELTKQLQDLQTTLTKEQTHDAEDHAALAAAHAQILQDQQTQTTLQQQILQLQFALAQGALRIQQFQAKLTAQAHDLSALRGQLATEKAHNAQLQTQTTELKTKVAALEAEGAAAKKLLASTAEELKVTRADVVEKEGIIEGLEDGIVAVKKDRDAVKGAYEDLKVSSSAAIQELEDEIAKLKAAPPVVGGGGGGGSGGGWPFPDGWPFPGDGGQGSGGCWPTPDELLRQMSMA